MMIAMFFIVDASAKPQSYNLAKLGKKWIGPYAKKLNYVWRDFEGFGIHIIEGGFKNFSCFFPTYLDRVCFVSGVEV